MKQWMSVKNLAVFAAVLLALLFPLMCFKMYYVHIGVLSLLHILLALGLNLVAGYAGQLSLAQAAFFGIGAYVSALLMLNLHWSFWLAAPMWARRCQQVRATRVPVKAGAAARQRARSARNR